MELDATGLTIDTTDQILNRIETDERDALGDDVETGASTPLGAINSITANDQRLIQELVDVVYLSAYRATATGASLDRVNALIGSDRLPATESTVSIDVTISGPVNLDPGLILIAVAGSPDRQFVNKNLFKELGAGTFAADFLAVETGPIEAVSGVLTVIPVPIVNITSVTNPADADLGRNIETDTAYRARADLELARPASCTLDGIRIDILDAVLDDNGDRLLEDVTVFENTGDTTDSDGVPPHAIEVVADDGTPPAATDIAIGQAVFDAKPGGIRAFGTITVNAVDSRKDLRPTGFSRPTLVPIELEINLTVGPDFSTGVSDRIKTAVAVFWQGFARADTDLIRSQLTDPIWEAVVKNEEVIDIVSIRTARIPDGLAFANITIAPRERGTVDTSDISVVGL